MTLGAAASFGALTGSPFVFAGVLCAAFGMGAIASLSLWCVIGRTLSRYLNKRHHWRMVNIALGLLIAISIIPIWEE
ncbi:MAG: hypothetical protein P8015_10100 [Acidihalobacter sp.]